MSKQRGGKDSKEETAGRRLRLETGDWRLEVYSSIICNISSNYFVVLLKLYFFT